MALVFGMTAVGCDSDSGSSSGSGTGGNGILTVINAPQVALAYIYADAPTPTTYNELSRVIGPAAMAALSTDNYSPYSLVNHPNVTPFTRTGSFLVVLLRNQAIVHCQGGVSFKNGSATVDFNSMTVIDPLAEY
jgi:hypothetical protein